MDEDRLKIANVLKTMKAPDCPEWVYVFVRPGHPLATMNLMITGVFSSSVMAATGDPEFMKAYAAGTADFLPFVPNSEVSMGFVSPFASGTVLHYRVEYDAELARKAYFPNSPSRLTGIYACESRDDCEAINRAYPDWDLDWVQRFKVQVALRATKVNMEIVSLMRKAYFRSSMEPQSVDGIWRAYWSGADEIEIDLPSLDATRREVHKSGVLWEWIIDGNLVHESRV